MGLLRELNPGFRAPELRSMPLDQAASWELLVRSDGRSTAMDQRERAAAAESRSPGHHCGFVRARARDSSALFGVDPSK